MGDEDEDYSYVDSIKFSSFCDVCDKMRQIKNKKRRLDILKSYIDFIREKAEGGGLHPIMRLLLPSYDRDRGRYGIKEDKLGKIYVKVLDLPKSGKDATSLLNYRMPNKFKFHQPVTDYADIVYRVMETRSIIPSDLTIADINRELDKIAKSFAENSPEAKYEVFFESLISKLSAKEQKWAVRIILKSMHLGIGHKQILSFYHPDAFKFLSTTFSLKKLCSTLRQPSVRFFEININLFEAFRPMLSEKCDIEKIKLEGTYYVETKLDGERYQIHYSDGEFKFFSRNGFEASTYIFGNTVSTGYFTSNLKPQLNPQFTSFILDGEMMAWHKIRKCPITQGNFRDVGKVKVGGDVQPCYFPFDIVYCNGELISYKPLHERIEILEKVFTPKEGVIMQLKRKTIRTKEQIVQLLNEAIETHEEGIIVKDIDSIYKPNERFGNWYKIKPEYSEGALTELDVLIIGGCFGTGQFKGTVNRFLVGLAALTDTEGNPKEFHSLTMVSSGFTLEELDELHTKLNPHWISKKKPNAQLQFGKIVPDVYIEPSNSVIVQVKASQIIWSDKFKCGYSLRFPRVDRVRYDKSWKECLSVKEFEELNKKTSGMLTSGPLGIKIENGSKKRKALEVLPQFKKSNLKGLEIKSNIFQNKRICVISGSKEHKKEEMEKLIFENGGKIHVMPDSKTFCIVAGDTNIRVKNFISSKKHIVANHLWVLDCIVEDRLLPWMPYYVLSVTQLCESNMAEEFDVFGDSYCDRATKRSIEYSLKCDEMMKRTRKPVTPDEFNEISDLLCDDNDWFSCFKNSSAFFVESQEFYEEQGSINLKEDICCFKFLAGKVTHSVGINTDYIVVHKKFKPDIYKLLELKKNGSFSTVIISNDWIRKTWELKKIIDYNNYIIENVTN